jgi:hypothetical protein
LLDHFRGKPAPENRQADEQQAAAKLGPQIYSEAVQQAIPSIPPNIIEPLFPSP